MTNAEDVPLTKDKPEADVAEQQIPIDAPPMRQGSIPLISPTAEMPRPTSPTLSTKPSPSPSPTMITRCSNDPDPGETCHQTRMAAQAAHRWRRAGPPSHRAGGAGGRGESPRPASTPRHGSVRPAGRLRCSRRGVARTGPRYRRKLGTGIVEAATVQSVLVEPLGFAPSFCIRRVPGGGRWGGAAGVAVPERRTGSGTGGEDEVRSVDASSGGVIAYTRRRPLRVSSDIAEASPT